MGNTDVMATVTSPMTDLLIEDGNDNGQVNFHGNAITTQTMEMEGNTTFLSQADLTINQGLTWNGPGTIGGSGAINLPQGSVSVIGNESSGRPSHYLDGRTLNSTQAR